VEFHSRIDGTNVLLDANENAFGPGLALNSEGALQTSPTGKGSGSSRGSQSPAWRLPWHCQSGRFAMLPRCSGQALISWLCSLTDVPESMLPFPNHRYRRANDSVTTKDRGSGSSRGSQSPAWRLPWHCQSGRFAMLPRCSGSCPEQRGSIANLPDWQCHGSLQAGD
jgi:hypothetical protein